MLARCAVFALLLALLALLQWHLFGPKGRVAVAHQLERQIAEQQAINTPLRQENAQLQTQVRQLQAGDADIIEEKARSDLGMIGAGEIFVRIIPGN